MGARACPRGRTSPSRTPCGPRPAPPSGASPRDRIRGHCSRATRARSSGGPRRMRGPGSGRPSVDRGPEVLKVRDDDLLPAALQELDRRLDLRAHTSRRELARGQVLLRLCDRHAVEGLLRRLAEIQRDLRDVRRDREMLPSERPREDRGREVLVDHRLDADEARAPPDDGDAASTCGDHDAAVAVPDEPRDDVLLDDVQGMRRRHDAPPPAPLVEHHLPAFRALHDDLVLPGVVRPDRLRRIRERRVVGVDEDLRDDARDVTFDASVGELVPERLREQVPDLRLALRAADIEGHRGHEMAGLLVLHEDVADLGPIAVRHDHVVPGLDELRETRRRPLDAPALARRIRGFACGEERVPADCHDDLLHIRLRAEGPRYFAESIRTFGRRYQLEEASDTYDRRASSSESARSHRGGTVTISRPVRMRAFPWPRTISGRRSGSCAPRSRRSAPPSPTWRGRTPSSWPTWTGSRTYPAATSGSSTCTRSTARSRRTS